MDCSPPGSSVREIFPGKNTGVGYHFLLQGIFPTQGSNLRLLYWQADSLPLSHPGSTLLSIHQEFPVLLIFPELVLKGRRREQGPGPRIPTGRESPGPGKGG